MERLIREENGDLSVSMKDFHKVMRKLHAYENTGVSPTEALVLRKENEAMRAEISRLKAELGKAAEELSSAQREALMAKAELKEQLLLELKRTMETNRKLDEIMEGLAKCGLR